MEPSRNLRPLAEAQGPFYAGCDVGGTNIKLGIIDDQGAPVAYRSLPTQQELGPESAAERIAEALEAAMKEVGLSTADILRVGLATPGPMDIPRGMLVCPGNLPAWHDSPIRDLVSRATGKPVTFANDANAAAYGEYWCGAGQAYSSILLLTLGTGLGAGIIVDDRLIVGSHSCGGECGHIIIDSSDTAPANSLGIRGTLEGYVGAYGILRRTRELLAATNTPTPLRDLASEELTPLAIAKAAEAGDELALGIILETARYLAIGLVTIVHTVDPECVVLGGAMNFGGQGHPLGERFLAEVRSQARSRMIESLRDTITIDFATLEGDAGFIGAAGLARAEAQ